MASDYQKNLNNELTVLITKLLSSYLSIDKNDKQFPLYMNYIKNYLNDKSMLYISRPKDVEQKFNSLLEKLDINSQVDKSKLLTDYVNRLKTIYEHKSPVIKDNLYSYINLVLQLAHSPLSTVVNLDMMRENFENRYMKNKYEQYVKNNKYIDPSIGIELKTKLKFEDVDYNEKTPTWSEDEENNEDVDMDKEKKEDEKKEEIINKITTITLKKNKILNEEQKKKILFDIYIKLFPNTEYYSNMSKCFYEHLLNLNMRIGNNCNIVYVDNDFILNRILHQFSLFTEEDINNANSFIDKFSSLSPIEMSKDLMMSILTILNNKRHDLNFLRQIEVIFEHHEIQSVTFGKFTSIIKEFILYHDNIIDQCMKCLYYQKGKIENINIEKIIFAINEEKSQFSFIKQMMKECRSFISNMINTKKKLTILKFMNFYNDTVTPIIEYFITMTKRAISIKKKLISINKFTNSLLVKFFLDDLYHFTKSNVEIHIEVFMSIIEVYSKFIYEFIVNGNLIDVYNEFFIDHLLARKEKKKIIFCFNEKFQIFNWVDCFKIKSFSIDKDNEGACVPIAFMLNDIHFKILETGKTTFLTKNLNVINYFEDLNRDLLYSNTIIEKEKAMLTPCKKGEDFDELKKLNEHLKLRKEELIKKGNELEQLAFAKDEEVNKININSITSNKMNDESPKEILNFLNSNEENKQNASFLPSTDQDTDNDIEMNDINNKSIIHNINSISIESSPGNPELTQINNILFQKNPLSSSSLNTSNNNLYNTTIILSNLVLNRITKINSVINTKFIDVLMNKLHIDQHFDLMFHLYLFKAGFSMNKFIHELNSFIFSLTKTAIHVTSERSFFLKNLLMELAHSNGSDLSQFASQITKGVNISFNDISSLMFHSNDDLITMNYIPDLPISIFFDKNIIANYNSIFNFIVKLKRTFCLIRDITLDKEIKKNYSEGEGNLKTRKICKNFIEYRLFILDFANEFEFFVFHFVINNLIERFKKKIQTLNSIDQFINSHKRFVRDIISFLGLNDEKYMKKVYKIFNIIVSLPTLVNKYVISNKENEKEMDDLYMEIVNGMAKYTKNENKIKDMIDSMKEKLALLIK